MKISYSNQRVEKMFSDYNRMKRVISNDWIRTIKKHIDRLKAADCFGDFMKLGLGKPEQLSGYNQPTYSLHVSANTRLVFSLDCDEDNNVEICTEITIEGVCDYHGDKTNWFIP